MLVSVVSIGGIVVSTFVCRSLSQWFNSHSEHYVMNCPLVILKCSVNLFLSIIDVDGDMEIDSMSAWL